MYNNRTPKKMGYTWMGRKRNISTVEGKITTDVPGKDLKEAT